MQTIKGLIALLLVAAGVFTAVVIFNSKTEPSHEAAVEKATVADTGKPVKQPAMSQTTSADTQHNSQKSNL